MPSSVISAKFEDLLWLLFRERLLPFREELPGNIETVLNYGVTSLAIPKNKKPPLRNGAGA